MIKFKILLLALRPRHWVKNLFIFAGPFFSLKLFDLYNLNQLIQGFIYWCLMSSAVYLLNDIIDKKEDLLHPRKKNRPLASGALNIKVAYLLFCLLSVFSMAMAFRLNLKFASYIVLYLIINILYSLYLKHIFILDVACIAVGFVLRVISGAVLINVGFSGWIILCTFLLSLLLGFGKRMEEITILDKDAAYHRSVLEDYDLRFLRYIPYVLVTATTVSYVLYTVSREAVRKFATRDLIYTAPFVIYGLFRYVYVAYRKNKGADPVQVLFQDRLTLLNIILWIMATGFIIYIR